MKTKTYRWLLPVILGLVLANCDEDEQGPGDYYDQGDFRITMNAEKIPGKGQYRSRLESGDTLTLRVNIESTEALEGLEVIKTVNLQVDTSFGEDGVLRVDASGTAFDYDFTYIPSVDDVDQLVGFTFKAVTAGGRETTSDLTASISLSPRDNLPRRKWEWSSILHVNNEDNPNSEVIEDCERDNAYLFNQDDSMNLDYGTDTGAGACAFDGLNEFTRWYITEDEQHFIMEKHNVFTPDVIVADTFRIETLTVDKLALELTVDLSDLGLREEEIFLYMFEAAPRDN
ncbi:hypothetical protein [Sinomicrobium weinanense]|uniref:Uncharacterized protein n=1 Tax=Sinomicrobium weinanense TaxID=2842200 RepID=A0A926JWX5_9FLAO|nr:hypothetical protein [Sinomicrobium weinanense]MBC9798678.1 hypothetical protein [Sinomicrobium weinanense]MBU3123274.1 hypothetical protein [Sinomicrobium weinanense]